MKDYNVKIKYNSIEFIAHIVVGYDYEDYEGEELTWLFSGLKVKVDGYLIPVDVDMLMDENEELAKFIFKQIDLFVDKLKSSPLNL